MAVTKINGFRAPYRSLTFRQIADAQSQRNGVVAMSGVVSQSGLTITVPAFTFIQQGMLVKKDTATTLSAPTMDAPFYLVVTAPTPNAIDDLIFTFAKAPSDVAVSEAIVAAWDGNEWRLLPFLSFDGVYDEVNQANIDFDRVGPFSGVTTVLDGGNYKNVAGVVVDRQGLRQTLTEDSLFPVVADDPDWGRVDRIIYRRPADSENRIGVRRFYVGGTYDAAPATLYDTQAFSGTLVHRNTKTLSAADNSVHLFVATGYGGAISIYYRKIASDRTTELVAPVAIITGATDTDFDVAIDESGNLYVVYISGTDVKWRKFDSVGAPLTAALTVDAQSGQCAKPRIAIDPQNSRSYVVYQALVTVSQNQVFFVSVDLGGTIATASKNLNNDAFDQVEPSLYVTDDFLVYVAWKNDTLDKITYRIFDDIGNAFATAVDVSAATDRIGVGTLVNNAKTPKIWVTDNKVIVIAFLQDKGGSVFGLSLWNSKDGSAFMQELVSPTENFTRYDIFVDPIFNDYHLVVARSANLDFVKVRGQTVDFTLALAATGVSGLSTTRDAYGSMFTLWSDITATGYTNYALGINVLAIGSTTVIGGLNNANLSNQQFMTGVGTTPAVGDRAVITGSGVGNDGTYVITAVSVFSLNAANDRLIITVATPFAAAENPAPAVLTDYEAPDGNESRYIKNTAETQAHAFVLDELDTDVLLARIVLPGPTILNYPTGGSGGGGGSSDTIMPFGAAVLIDWEATTPGELTVSGGLKILDLLNNFTYNVADGAFPMAEDDALYVELDGSNFNPTAQVTSVATLPFGLPIQVLGVIKDGEFNPHLLGKGGMGQLDSGEAIVFGEDLADLQRARLGITGETSFEAFTSQIGLSGPNVSIPNALSQTNLMAGQNKHVRLVRGQWSWVKPNANELVVLTESFLQVPGVAENRNRIAPQTINLTADGQVAYVSINRAAGVAADLTVSVAAITALAVGRDTIILARRVGTQVVLEANGGTRLDAGSTIDIGQSISEENQTLLGLTATSKEGGVFTTAIGPSTENKYVVDGDTFEEAIKRLDGRDDTVRKVRLIDLISTTLPAGTNATIDGVSVADGDKVLFPNLGANPGVYQVSGVGVALVWTQLYDFGNSLSPSARSMVAVREGTAYLRTIWQYDTTNGWKPVELASLIKEPTGFPNRTDSLISFDDGTRTFEIAVVGDHFDYFIKGKAYRKDTAQTVVIPDTEGMHYIYFDGETLSSSTAFTTDLLKEYAFVATIYWDATNDVHSLLGDERHGLVMDADTHRYLHLNYGTRIRNGFSAGDLTVVGDGTADADAQLSLSGGVVVDEDLEHTVVDDATPTSDFEQILSVAAELPVFYRDGAAGHWRKDTATPFPVKQGTSRIAWNDPTGPWTTPDASNDGKFVSMWIFATNSIIEPIIAILGQAEWDTLSDAQQNDTYETLLLGALPAAEMKVLYRLIFETHSGFLNTPKAALRDIHDLRTSVDTGLPAYAPADHGLLTGLNDQDHPARAIFTDTTNFNGALSSSDDDVQKALDTLDNQVGAILANNPKFYREVIAAPTTTVDVTGFTFDPLDTVLDIELLVNGRWYPPCTAGDFSTGAWRKNSDSQIEVQESLPVDAEVVIWKQGTSSGGGGGSGDLENISVNPQPSVAAGQSLGTLARPWSGLYLKDTVTSQVYLLQITNGVVDFTEVP